MRSISRVSGASMHTIIKLLEDAGGACAAHHDKVVRKVRAERIQVDEIWSFVHAKAKNVPDAIAAPEDAGDIWTWVALDADSKLIVSWWVGPRDAGSAYTLMEDLRTRLDRRVQLTSDGLSLYIPAVEDTFGADIDYAQLVKIYGRDAGDDDRRYSPPVCTAAVKRHISGYPKDAHINTSFVERQNLSMRMGVRRYTRLTNAFSKKGRNHVHHNALWFTYYNWCRIHSSLRVTPAMQAGLTDELRDITWIVDLINERIPPPGPRGPYRKHTRPGRRKGGLAS